MESQRSAKPQEHRGTVLTHLYRTYALHLVDNYSDAAPTPTPEGGALCLHAI